MASSPTALSATSLSSSLNEWRTRVRCEDHRTSVREGDCGAMVRYHQERTSDGFPGDEVCLDGGEVYRGGHLCSTCDLVVLVALARARASRLPDEMRTSITTRSGHRLGACRKGRR